MELTAIACKSAVAAPLARRRGVGRLTGFWSWRQVDRRDLPCRGDHRHQPPPCAPRCKLRERIGARRDLRHRGHARDHTGWGPRSRLKSISIGTATRPSTPDTGHRFEGGRRVAAADRARGRRGISAARACFDLVDGGAQSPRETWLRLVVDPRRRLPRPQTQIAVQRMRGFQGSISIWGWQDIKVAPSMTPATTI